MSTGVGYGVTELTGNQDLGMAAGVLSSFAFEKGLDDIDESLNISGLSRPKGVPKANYADDFDLSKPHGNTSADVDIVRPNNFFDNQNFNNPSKISGSDYKNADYMTTNGNKYQYDFEARPVGDYYVNHNKNYVTNTSQVDIVNNNRVKNAFGDADDLFQVNSNSKMQDLRRLQTAFEGADAGNSRYNPYHSQSPDLSVRDNLSFIEGGRVTKGSTNIDDWINNTAALSKQSPIEIPSNATIRVQVKNGYDQISYKWSADGYNYEVRWHTKTPGAPEGQGNTWVISRVTPGTPTGQARVEHILVGGNWIPRYKWQDAINAYRNGTATSEQLQLLKDGHWAAP